MARIDEVVARYNAEVVRTESVATQALERAYTAAYERLERDIERLAEQIEALRRDGRDVSRAKVLRLERYADLERQLVAEIERIQPGANQLIQAGQRRLVGLGLQQSLESTAALLRNEAGLSAAWNRLPARSLQQLVGTLADGSPLAQLLDRLPYDTSQEFQRRLVEAVALGHNPRKTAAAMRQAIGLTQQRALLIATNEQIRAARGATLEGYRANSDIVEGWIRKAAHSPRTCIVCIELDGTVYLFESDAETDFHVKDRCTVIPKLRGREIETGEGARDWFERQPEKVQRGMMGPLAHDAWKRGEIELKDLVRVTDDPRWGRSATVGSVRRARGGSLRLRETPPTDLGAAEDRLVTERSEVLYAFGTDGKLVLQRGASAERPTELDITANDLPLLKDAVVTHNHPMGWRYPEGHPLRAGHSFSPDDVVTAIAADVREIRAVTPVYTYVMQREGDRWPSRRAVDTAYTRHNQRVDRDLTRRIRRGEMTQEEAEAVKLHMVWERVASSTGIIYRRVSR
jgi:hypothetical protein